jgi:hypothetical protein
MVTRTKRSIKRRNNKKLKKRLSKKLRGGVNSQNSTLSTPFALLETSNSQGTMNISELDSTQGPMNLSELNITDSSDINNTTLNTNDLSIDNQQDIVQNNTTTITPEANNELSVSTIDTDLSTLSGNTTSEEISMIFGGKKSKKYKKVRKVKKGSKKIIKTRNTRNNKRQSGGQGFTTSETINPIAYKEDEYDQFKNALNYKTN